MLENIKVKGHYGISLAAKRVAYLYIPKNASSAWKRLFINESTYASQRRDLSPIKFMARFHRIKTTEELAKYEMRVVVVRDPAERLISGYLNRVVTKPIESLTSQIRSITGENPEDINFFSFLDKYVLSLKDDEINRHFQSQTYHIANIEYNSVWRLDELKEASKKEFGERISQKYFSSPKNTTSTNSIPIENASNLKVQDIRNIWHEKGVLPTKNSFYEDHILKKVQMRYEKDYSFLSKYGKAAAIE